MRLLWSSFTVFLVLTSAHGADVAISALPAASSVSGSDVVPIVQSATTKKASFTVQKGLWDTFYQPLDGDLSALAALTGTNTIYYRSAASTWTPVTIVAPLSFSSGNLGTTGTTVGKNFFTLTNPSAITFTRINADNTVSALNASDFRAAIGAGTGGGDVSSNTSTSVDSEIALFSSTSGKVIKRATGSGTAVVTNGVLSVVATPTPTNTPTPTPTPTATPTPTPLAIFKTIAVSGQSDVVADSDADTLTLAEGSNVTITTNAGSDTITIAASGGGGGTTSQVTGSNFTTNTGSLDDITGLTFAASTNHVYEVDVLLKVQHTSTNGMKFALAYTGTTGAGQVLVIASQNNNNAAATYDSTVLGTVNGTARCTEASVDFTVWMKAIITTSGASGGNIKAQVQRLGAAQTATVYIGSRMTVTQLN